jgi:hypothetical protein
MVLEFQLLVFPLQYSDINDGPDFDVIANVTYETA